MALKKFKASPLPTPPREYDPGYMASLIRSIEAYFNRLDSTTGVESESMDAQVIQADEIHVEDLYVENIHHDEEDSGGEYGKFSGGHSTADAAGNYHEAAIDAVAFKSDGVAIAATNDGVKVTHEGVYMAQAQVVFRNTSGLDGAIDVDLRVNKATFVPDATHSETLPDGQSSKVLLSTLLQLTGGDTLNVSFKVGDVDLYVESVRLWLARIAY